MPTLEGGCSCGAVRYRLDDAPMFVHCCHCLDCQKQTGGAFAINALLEADRAPLTAGATVGYSMPTESGRPHVIHRCGACGTAVWSTYGGVEAVRFVRVSTLDTPHVIVPDVHIYCRSKVPWVRLPDDARVFAEFYDPRVEWPEASRARRRAAVAPRS